MFVDLFIDQCVDLFIGRCWSLSAGANGSSRLHGDATAHRCGDRRCVLLPVRERECVCVCYCVCVCVCVFRMLPPCLPLQNNGTLTSGSHTLKRIHTHTHTHTEHTHTQQGGTRRLYKDRET